MWIDYFHSFLYLKAELRYNLDWAFSVAILAAILENMQLLLLFSTYLISTSFILSESTLHSFLYLKAELRYIRFRFSAAILAVENMRVHIWFLRPLFHMNRLHLSLYLNAELRYIEHSEFRRPSWPPSWIFYSLYEILHNNTSVTENHWHCMTIFTGGRVILVSRIGRHIGPYWPPSWKILRCESIPIDLPTEKNIRKNSLCFVCSLQLEILRKTSIFP